MRIDFLTISTMEVWHYAPVAKALGAGVAFTSPQKTGRRILGGWSDPDEIDALLRKLELPPLTAERRTAEVVITTQSADFVEGYAPDTLRGRLMYGSGLAAPEGKASRIDNFDFYLVHGPFSLATQFKYHALASRLLGPEKVAIIGYPKYDQAWQGAWPRKPKPQVLYMPTWSERSSVDRYYGPLLALGDRYELILKPHHASDRQPPGITVTDDPFMLARVNLVIADLVSGALSEAILLRKKVVALGKTSNQLLSISPIPICTDPNGLGAAIDAAWQLNYYSEPLVSLREKLFTTTEGYDAQIAARAIKRFHETRNSYPRIVEA